MMRVALFVCLAAAGLAGCGSSDREDAERAVTEFADAVNDRDSEKMCESFTQEALEQVTGATGDGARDQCEEVFASGRRPRLEIGRVVKSEVSGDSATVTVELEGRPGPRPQVFELEKEDGEFRISSAGS